MGIKRPREILNEVTKLRMFETSTKIVKFLKDEYGLAATVETSKPNEFIDVFLTNFRHADNIEVDLPEDKIATSLLKMFNEIHKDETLRALNVWPTEYGYVIVLDDTRESDKLNENFLYYYYYSKATKDNTEEEHENLNENYSMRQALKEAKEDEEDLLKKLAGNEEVKEDEEPKAKFEEVPEEDLEDNQEEDLEDNQEEVKVKLTKEELADDVSNKILDDKFVWFFMIMDDLGNELTEEIINLDEAIDYLVDNEEATLLVAYPYVDPNPDDANVDLVFADNPGPVIIYDGEEE